MAIFPVFFSTFLALFLLLSPPKSSAFRIVGNVYYDLEETYELGFKNEAINWTPTGGLIGTKTTNECWGEYIMGGADVLSSGQGYFTRKHTGLPPHNTIYLAIKIFKIDSWDVPENDHFALGFDSDITLHGWAFGNVPGYSQNKCGYGWNENPPVMVYATVPHTADDLSFHVYTKCNGPSSDESLGFRDVTLTFLQLDNPPTTGSYCGITNGWALPDKACVCQVGQYLTNTAEGPCKDCEGNCATCPVAPRDCTSCLPGWFMLNDRCYPTCDPPLESYESGGITYCRTPCSGQYAYWDKSCGMTCEYSNSYATYTPVVGEVESTFQVCRYPCPDNQVLYWNTSCHDTCESPLKTVPYRNRDFCAYICADNEYLYWNGSCFDDCEYPLTKETQGSKNFCWYTCEPSQWLYWDQTCQESCPGPLLPETRGSNFPRQFCWSPCPSESPFLYWNGSCLPECSEPLETRFENRQLFCDFPCLDKTQHLFWNGSCLDSCPQPFIEKTEKTYKYCNPPCQDPEMYYYEELKTCSYHCDSPDDQRDYLRCFLSKVQAMPTGNWFLHAPLESGTVTLVKLVKIMQYVKYLDINMPPRLQRLSVGKGRNVLSLSSGIQMSRSLKEDFPDHPLSYVYSKNHLHSSFLVNYWEDLTNVLIALTLAAFLLILEKLCKRSNTLKAILQTLRVITVWNFVIMAFFINIDDIILFSAVEFKFGTSNGASVAMAIIFICLIVGLITASVRYIIKRKQAKNPKILESLQVFVKGFTNANFFSRYFFVAYVLRIGLPLLFAVVLEATPLGNTILQAILNCSMLALIITKKPFTKKINHYQILLFESIALLMNISMFSLTILSIKDKENSKFAIFLGDFVIVGNDIINLMCLAFLIIKLFIEVRLIRAFLKKNEVAKPEKITLWLQLIFIPLQLAHMGFEEVTVYDMASQDPRTTFRNRQLRKVTPVPDAQNEYDQITITELAKSQRLETFSKESAILPSSHSPSLIVKKPQVNHRENSPDGSPINTLDQTNSPLKKVLKSSPFTYLNSTPSKNGLLDAINSSSSTSNPNSPNLQQESPTSLRLKRWRDLVSKRESLKESSLMSKTRNIKNIEIVEMRDEN